MADSSIASAHLSDIATELDTITAIAIDLAGTVPAHILDALLAAVARVEDCAVLAAGSL